MLRLHAAASAGSRARDQVRRGDREEQRIGSQVRSALADLVNSRRSTCILRSSAGRSRIPKVRDHLSTVVNDASPRARRLCTRPCAHRRSSGGVPRTRTLRPRRTSPVIAAWSQTSVATPKTRTSEGRRPSTASAFGFVKTSKLFFSSRISRRPRRAQRMIPGGYATWPSGSGSSCSVSGIFCAPRVPRRQCGG